MVALGTATVLSRVEIVVVTKALFLKIPSSRSRLATQKRSPATKPLAVTFELGPALAKLAWD